MINTFFIQGYAGSIIGIINNVLAPVLLAIAFIVFLWGVFNYFILHGTSEDSREKGRDFILYGIIGFVVIFGLWGLVAIVGNTLGLEPGGNAPPAPTFNAGGGSPAPSQNIPIPKPNPTTTTQPSSNLDPNTL